MDEERLEPPGWVLPLLIGLLVAFWTVGTISTALTPALLRDHPLALVALERRFIRWVENLFPRFARPLVFLFPGLIVCLLAGVTRMKVRSFLLWNFATTM
jgi:uncharacterized membrane protein YdjX (TVP38/TMEM64 family)